MSTKLSTIKAIYRDVLSQVYTPAEAENYFYIILEWLEKKSKTDVIVGSETLMQDTYLSILTQLKASVPVQYITNEAPFYGSQFYVDKRVLIPRPETEQLVHLVIEENIDFKGSILDIGTGSGCIALTLKKYFTDARVFGCDVSDDALRVAMQNSKNLQLDVDFFVLNVLNEELSPYDIIVSNPPYIDKNEMSSMHANVIDYEPHLALFVEDSDPLLFYKVISQKALKMGATCYFETSEFYRDRMDNWLMDSGVNYKWMKDFQGKDRLLKVWG